MTVAELSNYNGRDGKPAYVAVSGVIYDLSSSKLWIDGNHERAHQAGQDLTEELKTAPHVRAVIERFPVIGQLQTTTSPKATVRRPLLPIVAVAVVILVILILLMR